MSIPSDSTIERAIDWLRQNESGDDEQKDCFTVAAWLENELVRKSLRKAAREYKVPVQKLYSKLGV